MSGSGISPSEITVQQKRWAIFRLIIGQAQIAGATATLWFLIQTGQSHLTLVGAGITAAFFVVSVYLFRIRKKG